jgi:ABC-type oligopeptide transport system ATPase subunit
MILALSGKSGSGKDIVGKIIQYLTDKDKGGYQHPNSQDDFESYCKNFKQKYCDWEIKKFAGKVKEIASLLTGIPIEKFEDQEFKKKTFKQLVEEGYISQELLNTLTKT